MLGSVEAGILLKLLNNSRISIAALSRAYGISRQGVYNKMRNLMEGKVIRRFTVDVNPYKVGLSLRAILRIAMGFKEAEIKRLILRDGRIDQAYLLMDGELLMGTMVHDIGELRKLIRWLRRRGCDVITYMVRDDLKYRPTHPVERALKRRKSYSS